MEEGKDFYTLTMAKLYAAQGYTDKAIRIYRYLLERQPDRKDLREELALLEMSEKSGLKDNEEKLVALLQQWLDLLWRTKQIERLKRLREKVLFKQSG